MAGRELDELSGAVLARAAETPAGAEIMRAAGVDPAAPAAHAEFLKLPVLDRSLVADYQRRDPEHAGFSTIPLHGYGRLGLHAGGELDISYAGTRGAEVMAELFGQLGVRESDVVVNTFGYHMSTVAHVFDEGLRRLGACVVAAGPGNAETQVELISRVGATVWLGFPSFLWRMVTETERGDAVAQSLRLAVLGGEFAPKIRAQLLERFDIASREFYGVSILGPAAFECEAGVGMHVMNGIHVEIVDTGGAPVESEEAGQIVLTPLENEYVIPRLGTGDLSRWMTEPCACGRTSPRIEGVLGRVGEAVKARGIFIYPRDVRNVREALPGATHCTLVISRSAEPPMRDELVLQVAAGDGASQDLESKAAEAFQTQCRLRLDHVVVSDAAADDRVIVDTRDWEVAAQ